MGNRTVLVLGAYGEAGAAIVRGLCATARFDVVAAGRNAAKLAGLARSIEGLSTCQLDITHDEALRDTMACAGLVINCVGPYIGTGAQVAMAALDVGIPYLDIASEQEHYRRLRAMQARCIEAGGLILTGAGAYPGLSGLLLKAMIQRHPGARGAEMGLISGPHADPEAGAAQSLSASTLHSQRGAVWRSRQASTESSSFRSRSGSAMCSPGRRWRSWPWRSRGD
jgi:saccharopine dehydrogenase-like NADP-dependent oxidoreductase